MPDGSNVLIVSTDAALVQRLRDLFVADGCPKVRVAATADAAVAEVIDMPRDYTSAVVVDTNVVGSDVDGWLNSVVAAGPPNLRIVLLTSVRPLAKPAAVSAILSRRADPSLVQKYVMDAISTVQGRLVEELSVTFLAFDRLSGQVVDGGSGALVDTGRRRFVVTAGHVVEGLRRRDVMWKIGGQGSLVDVDGWAELSCSSAPDIGTIAVPDDFDPRKIDRQFYRGQWPPPRAQKGDYCQFVGFPGAIRRRMSRQTILTRGMLFQGMIDSSGPERFVMSYGDDATIMGSGPELTRFGGISGCAVFVNGSKGLLLVGVISDCTVFDSGLVSATGAPIHHGVVFYGVHADVISIEGTFVGTSDG